MGAQIILATHDLSGRNVAQIIDTKGLNHDETVKEAIDYGYVVGKAEVVSGIAKGTLKAMKDGVEKDGNGRKIDEYFSLQPSIRGRLEDPTDPVTQGKVVVELIARALKQLKIDTSDWTILIEGSNGAFSINVVSTGEKSGEVLVGEDIHLNGIGLILGENDSVSWKVLETEVEGTIAASKLTSDWTRITATGDALAELNDPANNGKTIVFTVKINGKRAVKTAILKVA